MGEPPTDEHLRQFQSAAFPADWGGFIGWAIGMLLLIAACLIWGF